MGENPTVASPEPEVPTHIPVRVEDLDAIRAALNSVYHHQQTYDSIESYRKLENTVKSSKMTQAVGRSLQLVQAYLTQYLSPEEEKPAEEDDSGEV